MKKGRTTSCNPAGRRQAWATSSTTWASARSRRSPRARTASACSTSWAASRARSRR
ncbi:hypothetical protein APY03_5854 [Variovorax sp. WDL1]|nr:hypothetical protein APY03_5854 [Variovorax sp. WDL1]